MNSFIAKFKEKLLKIDNSIWILISSLIYFSFMFSREWTWIFVSQDSGDWLAAGNINFTPQPFGSPLYIGLMKFVSLISSPENYPALATFLLSVIPAAITLMLIYKIVLKLKGQNTINAIIVTAVCAGCCIFLTQATILEEYAIATMFVTMALYNYVNNNKKWTIISLALGCSVHVLPVLITIIAFFVEWKNKKEYLKYVPYLIIIGFLPYIYIPITMMADNMKILAGNFSLESFNTWLGSSGTFGSLSIADTPKRLLQAFIVIIASYGLAILPIFKSLKKPYENVVKLSIAITGFCLWAYITDRDYTTWTFTIYALPFVAILIATGLNYLSKNYLKLILLSGIAIMILNSVFLNANIINSQNNTAKVYEYELNGLENGSCLVVPRGCATGLGILYIMSSGKDIVPLLLYPTDKEVTEKVYCDYLNWLNKTYQINGKNTLQIIQDALNDGRKVYYAKPSFPLYESAIQLLDIGKETIFQVVSVNVNPNWSKEDVQNYR